MIPVFQSCLVRIGGGLLSHRSSRGICKTTVNGSEIRLTTWDGAKTPCKEWDMYDNYHINW